MVEVQGWLIIAVLISVVILAILAAVLKYMSQERRRPDYYSFFVMGFIWLAVGIPLQNNALMILGAIFAVVGLTNVDKWNKSTKAWTKLNKSEKKFRIIILTVLGALIVAAIVLFFLVKYGIL